MNRIAASLAAFGVAIFPAVGLAQTILDGPQVNPANGHIYYLLTPATWTASENAAVSLGGHLTTINDAPEQAWVFNTFGTVGGVDRSLWIGLNDQAVEGNFVWASGEASAYTHWLLGQPDNFLLDPAGEDYAHMMKTGNGFGHPPGFWNDMDDADSFSAFQPTAGVVEVVPEPSCLVLALISAGAILMSPARRRSS